jgi:hypothetical protein
MKAEVLALTIVIVVAVTIVLRETSHNPESEKLTKEQSAALDIGCRFQNAWAVSQIFAEEITDIRGSLKQLEERLATESDAEAKLGLGDQITAKMLTLIRVQSRLLELYDSVADSSSTGGESISTVGMP